MKVTRRQFVKSGVAAFTVTFAAPEFLSDVVRAQGAHVRNLVVLYLSGGNDSLSMLVPYNDPFYTSRRPTIRVPAGNVLQIGTDSSRVALGLHPRLTGLKDVFDRGRLALIQRHECATRAFDNPSWPGFGIRDSGFAVIDLPRDRDELADRNSCADSLRRQMGGDRIRQPYATAENLGFARA